MRALKLAASRLRERWGRIPPSVRAALVFAVLSVLFFAPAWATGRLASGADVLQSFATFQFHVPHVPYNGLLHDIALVFEPWLHLLRQGVSQLELPLWNPYQGLGTPHLANGQSALFYPGTWFVPLLGYRFGLVLLHASKLFSIGFFTYMFLRSLKLHHRAALIGGAAFMFTGFNVGWLYWPLPAVVGAMPLMLWLIERVIAKPTDILRYLPITLGVALGVFAGHPETLAHVGIVVGLYVLFRIGTAAWPWKRKLYATLGLSAVAVLGVALSAVQLLPTLHYLRDSAALAAVDRDGSYDEPREYLTLNILPDLLGNHTFPDPARGYFGAIGTNYNEATGGAVGLAVSFLAVLSLVYLRREKNVWFFAGLVGFVGIVVYRVEPFYDLFRQLPLMSNAVNERFGFAIAFGLCVLAALLLSRVFEGKLDLRRPATFYTAVVFLAGLTALAAMLLSTAPYLQPDAHGAIPDARYVAYLIRYVPIVAIYAALLCTVLLRAKAQGLFYGMLLAVLVELGVHGSLYEPAVEARFFYPVTPPISFLQEHLGDQRFIAMSLQFAPDAATAYGIRQFQNYDGLLVKGFFDAANTHASMPGNWMVVERADPRYLSAAGVKYLVQPPGFDVAHVLGPTYQAKSYKSVFKDDLTEIVENLDVWPRAFQVPSPKFYDRVPLGEKPVAAEVVDETLNSITLQVDASRDEFVVVSNTYASGWAATVDGKPATVQQADLNFQAVAVPAGSHEVVLQYRPRSFYAGAGVTGVTALGLAATGLWVGRRRRARAAVLPATS